MWMEGMMTHAAKWRTQGVTVVRAASLDMAQARSSGLGRARAFDFAGSDGRETWIGKVALRPNASTGAHHHGSTEVAIYVVHGRGEIRWGERLEFATEVGEGDFVYFAPWVPHQERNLDARNALDLVVVRSNGQGIAVGLDIAPAERPEMVR
jgi:uncharacterized RmlC-like cupin family protein